MENLRQKINIQKKRNIYVYTEMFTHRTLDMGRCASIIYQSREDLFMEIAYLIPFSPQTSNLLLER